MKETYVNPMLQMLLQMEAIIDLLTNGPVPGNEQALPLVLVWFTVIKNISDYNDLLLIVVLFARYNV